MDKDDILIFCNRLIWMHEQLSDLEKAKAIHHEPSPYNNGMDMDLKDTEYNYLYHRYRFFFSGKCPAMFLTNTKSHIGTRILVAKSRKAFEQWVVDDDLAYFFFLYESNLLFSNPKDILSKVDMDWRKVLSSIDCPEQILIKAKPEEQDWIIKKILEREKEVVSNMKE